MGEPDHLRATYNDIHNIIKASVDEIAAFKPNLFVAIGSYYLLPVTNDEQQRD